MNAGTFFSISKVLNIEKCSFQYLFFCCFAVVCCKIVVTDTNILLFSENFKIKLAFLSNIVYTIKSVQQRALTITYGDRFAGTVGRRGARADGDRGLSEFGC